MDKTLKVTLNPEQRIRVPATTVAMRTTSSHALEFTLTNDQLILEYKSALTA